MNEAYRGLFCAPAARNVRQIQTEKYLCAPAGRGFIMQNQQAENLRAAGAQEPVNQAIENILSALSHKIYSLVGK